MKKSIHIITAFLVLVAFSCKKERAANNSSADKLYTVTFNISSDGFTQSISKSGNLKVNGITDPAAFKNYFGLLFIDFGVGNEQQPGSPTQYDTKTLTTLNVKYQYKPGVYKMNMFATQYGLGYSSAGIYYLGSLRPPDNRDHYIGHWKDSFYAAQTFTVKDNDLTVNLNLNRINAGIEVDIADALPQNVTGFSLEFSTYYLSFNSALGVVGPPTPQTPSYDRETFRVTVPDSLRGKPNFKIEYLSLNTMAPFDMTLTAYDKNYVPVAVQNFKNVKLEINRKNIYRGSMFGGPTSGNAGFPTKIDTSWNPTPIIQNF